MVVEPTGGVTTHGWFLLPLAKKGVGVAGCGVAGNETAGWVGANTPVMSVRGLVRAGAAVGVLPQLLGPLCTGCIAPADDLVGCNGAVAGTVVRGTPNEPGWVVAGAEGATGRFGTVEVVLGQLTMLEKGSEAGLILRVGLPPVDALVKPPVGPGVPLLETLPTGFIPLPRPITPQPAEMALAGFERVFTPPAVSLLPEFEPPGC